jgi:hypothetical protein
LNNLDKISDRFNDQILTPTELTLGLQAPHEIRHELNNLHSLLIVFAVGDGKYFARDHMGLLAD